MGKLILLREVREAAAREALALAAAAEDRAREAEATLEGRRRELEDRRSSLEREPPGEQPPAEVLQFRGRATRMLRALEVDVQVRLAAMRGERISAEEAARRVEAKWLAARRARERLQERQAAAREERKRGREAAEEGARDDLPAGPGGPDGER